MDFPLHPPSWSTIIIDLSPKKEEESVWQLDSRQDSGAFLWPCREGNELAAGLDSVPVHLARPLVTAIYWMIQVFQVFPVLPVLAVHVWTGTICQVGGHVWTAKITDGPVSVSLFLPIWNHMYVFMADSLNESLSSFWASDSRMCWKQNRKLRIAFCFFQIFHLKTSCWLPLILCCSRNIIKDDSK